MPPRRRSDRSSLYEGDVYRDLLARVAANVRRLREAKGWTQEDCAEKCGDMAPPLLRRIELASTNLTAVTVARLCEGLGVDVTELVAPGTPFVKRRPGRPAKEAVEAPTEAVAPGEES